MSNRLARIRVKSASARSSKAFMLSTLSIASFADTFLYSIVVPIFPTSLVTRASVEPEDVQSWLSVLLAIYGAALLVTAPIAGYVLDKCQSRKNPFLLGLVSIISGTAMICVGNSPGLLIAGRIISGSSAAVVWTTSAAMVVANIEESKIGGALGTIALALNMGGVAGPLLGGVVYEHGGYYSVFAMAFGVLSVDTVLRIALIEGLDAQNSTPSGPGDVARLTDLGALEQPLHSEAGRSEVGGSSQSWRRNLPSAIALVSYPRVLITVLGSFVMALILAAFEAVLPLFVEKTFKFSSTGAGLIFIPLALPSLIDPLVGRLCDKQPRAARYIATVGFLGAAVPLVLLRLVDHGGIRQIILLCFLLSLIGFCLAITAPPLMIEVSASVVAIEREFPGMCGSRGAVAQGFGLFICAFAGGTLVGPVLAGFVKEHSNWGTMSWALALVSGVASIPMGLWLGGRIGR